MQTGALEGWDSAGHNDMGMLAPHDARNSVQARRTLKGNEA
jgi:hypothetical protein